MPTQAYSFTVHLMNPFDDEELCDRIYGVRDDSTATSDREGRLLLEFDREAESLDNAIRSALADLVSVGYVIPATKLTGQEAEGFFDRDRKLKATRVQLAAQGEPKSLDTRFQVLYAAAS